VLIYCVENYIIVLRLIKVCMATQEIKLVTIQEAADMLGVHPETLRRWDNDGKLKSVRVSERGHRRYSLETIRAFVSRDVAR
jgi:excisionase family DNA binding protein